MAEPEQRFSRRKAVLLWTALVAALAAAFFSLWVIHWLLHPWAVSLPGKPGLVGYWQGEVPFGPDDTRRIVLDLNGDPGTGIEGSAKVCGGPHRTTYDIDGDASNRSGTRFSLGPSVWNYDPGIYLRRMTGEWDGADLVTIDAKLVTFTADNNNQPERPVNFQLHRTNSDEFDTTC